MAQRRLRDSKLVHLPLSNMISVFQILLNFHVDESISNGRLKKKTQTSRKREALPMGTNN